MVSWTLEKIFWLFDEVFGSASVFHMNIWTPIHMFIYSLDHLQGRTRSQTLPTLPNPKLYNIHNTKQSNTSVFIHFPQTWKTYKKPLAIPCKVCYTISRRKARANCSGDSLRLRRPNRASESHSWKCTKTSVKPCAVFHIDLPCKVWYNVCVR